MTYRAGFVPLGGISQHEHANSLRIHGMEHFRHTKDYLPPGERRGGHEEKKDAACGGEWNGR
jgi:hypothetical protein